MASQQWNNMLESKSETRHPLKDIEKEKKNIIGIFGACESGRCKELVSGGPTVLPQVR